MAVKLGQRWSNSRPCLIHVRHACTTAEPSFIVFSQDLRVAIFLVSQEDCWQWHTDPILPCSSSYVQVCKANNADMVCEAMAGTDSFFKVEVQSFGKQHVSRERLCSVVNHAWYPYAYRPIRPSTLSLSGIKISPAWNPSDFQLSFS